MLFDLRSGKRRRVIQVSYAILAVLFLFGFVGFGIGGDVSGGLFDAIGVGSRGGGSTSSQYEDEIERLEQRLEADPKDERALLALARLHALDGQRMVEEEADPVTGLPELTDDGRAELEAAADAWSRYLKTDPKKPNADVAAVISQANYLLQDPESAAKAQEIVAEDSPSGNTWGRAAIFYYIALEIGAGDEAAKRALAEADPAQRASTRKELGRYAKLAKKQKKALAKARAKGESGEAPLQGPFGGLGAPGAGGG